MILILAANIDMDFDLYPRKQVDGAHVELMMEALELGANLPPLLICKSTKKLIDGFHRLTALMRKFGPDYEVMVVEKIYNSARERFLDAIKHNAQHGLKLSDDDRRMCVLRAMKLGARPADISLSLNVTRPAMARLQGSPSRTATTLETQLVIHAPQSSRETPPRRNSQGNQERGRPGLSGLRNEVVAASLAYWQAVKGSTGNGRPKPPEEKLLEKWKVATERLAEAVAAST